MGTATAGTTQHVIRTTVGDLIAACYEAALSEVGDEALARRLASVVLSDITARQNQYRHKD